MECCGFPEALDTEYFSWAFTYQAMHIWLMGDDGVEYGYVCFQSDKKQPTYQEIKK